MNPKSKKINYLFPGLAALLFACNVSIAQESEYFSSASENARASLSSGSDSFPLDELRGFTQTYFYSPGHETRANDIAVFMENAGKYFEKEISFTPQTILYILAAEHWKAFAVKELHDVYGFPHNIDRSHLAIAAEDNDFWRSFLPPVDQLPPSLAAQVTRAYAKKDGTYSMMPFFDLLALHELGHSYTAQAGLKMHRNWMSELFVNIMLHTYVAEKEPQLLQALETFPNMVLGGGTAEFKYTNLVDFERLYATLGMGPKNYGWYQCRLHSAAKDIYNSGGKDVLIRLWDALKTHQEEMTDETFVSLLKEVHPSVAEVYLGWDEK